MLYLVYLIVSIFWCILSPAGKKKRQETLFLPVQFAQELPRESDYGTSPKHRTPIACVEKFCIIKTITDKVFKMSSNIPWKSLLLVPSNLRHGMAFARLIWEIRAGSRGPIRSVSHTSLYLLRLGHVGVGDVQFGRSCTVAATEGARRLETFFLFFFEKFI